jgi:transcriptional regulator with XRE-family HTH domain
MPIDPVKLYDDGDICLRVVAHVLAFMEERGISQNEIARRAGVESGRLSKFFSGERGKRPSTGLIMRLANAIESNPSKILREPPPGPFYEKALRRAGLPSKGREPPRPASRSTVQHGKRTSEGRAKPKQPTSPEVPGERT